MNEQGDWELQRRLSDVNATFLDEVGRDPAWLRRDSFADLDAPHPLIVYPQQSWPLFVDEDVHDSLTTTTSRLALLMRSSPVILDELDMAGLTAMCEGDSEYAGLIRDLLIARGTAHCVSRVDFALEEEVRLLEANVLGNIGGTELAPLATRLMGIPIVAEFLERHDLRPTYADTISAFLRHIVDTVVGEKGPAECNIVFVTHELDAIGAALAMAFQGYLEGIYASVRETHSAQPSGRIFIRRFDQLEAKGDHVRCEGVRVHALTERAFLDYPKPVIQLAIGGAVTLFNGPLTPIMSDKGNMALLSVAAVEGRLSDDETELVERHVPWTRQVRRMEVVDPHRERRQLERLLLDERGDLVLKARHGYGGNRVILGRDCSKDAWERAVGRALHDGDWIVQALVDGPCAWMQTDAEGAAVHRVVWGGFDMGGTPAGFLLRAAPAATEGPVNAARGATRQVPLVV